MDRAAIERLIEEAYATRTRGDLAAIRRLFVDRPRFEVAGSPEACVAACCVEGREGFEATLEAMVATWQWLGHTVQAMLVDGDRAAVHWRARLRHVGSGEVVETEAVDLFTFADGKIATFTEFCDTALANRILTAGARAA